MNKKLEMAKELAKKITKSHKKINELVRKNQFNFDVFKDEDLGWVVQTSYCQMGGCMVDFIGVDSEEKGKYIAAKMTLEGLEVNYKGLCSDCRIELMEMQM